MALEIEVRSIAARPYVGVRRQLKPSDLGAACGEIYPKLHEWLKAKGLSPDGPPALVYHSMDEKTGTFDAQPAFFVSEAELRTEVFVPIDPV